ncbi:unnamed protein product [Rhizophagus irregularis]|nr:unnamed protein product [Rhizophagus irregularis]
MLYLLVQVNESTKCVISERVVSIKSTNNQFKNLFDAMTSGQYNDREVQVFVRREKSEKLAKDSDTPAPVSTQNQPNVFNILMRNSNKLLLPQHRTVYNNYDQLYNEIIEIFQQKLAQLSSSLELSINQPWACNDLWNQVMLEILSLVKILRKYSEYLVTTTASMSKLHHSDESARNPENSSTMYQIPACKCDSLYENYIQLNDTLLEEQVYRYINIQPYLPINIMKRYRFIKELQLTFPIGIYRYHQGNYLGTINYIWKIPDDEVFNDEKTLKARMLARIHERLPHYFTRQMRKNYSYISKVSPAVLRMLYFDLTGDISVTSNTISRDVEERLRLMLRLANPAIVFDLRTNNGFNGTKFNVFWDELEAYFNEQNLLVTDERRHESVLYMPLALSVRDLCKIIVERLKIIHNNPLPFTIHIPSQEWIRLQFCPTNATTTRSIHHTSRFNVKFQVQSWLLRKNSDDAHYCAALFRYLREFCIQYHQWTCLISADDKHKIPIGEDVAVSTGVRNRRSMVAQDSILAAADHDFTKLSLIPSVIFFISIPNDISGSFYDGQVFVSYKDTVFEPRDFDLLVAVRTASNHSWTNPAERIMSTLNLGLQGVALKRDQMSSESEALFDMTNTLSDIRQKAQEFNELESELKESIATSEESINELFESIFVIDSTLKIEETTQIKKCNNTTCLYCKPIRLPSSEFRNLSFLSDPIPSQDNTDHYATFQDVYRTETTEKYRPTYIQSQANAEPIPKSILVVGKIRSYINCEDCEKRRCVYSDKSLTCKEQQDYQQALDSYSYSCGAPIFPDDHYLKEIVFVRTRISCDLPIEILYYSSYKSGNYPICYYCGESEDLVTTPQSLKECFKQIYPLCEECRGNGKEFYTKGEIKTNGRSSKRHKT